MRPFRDVADPVELVVSEFFTNAVTHTASGERGGEVFVSIVGLVYGVVHLEVVDQGPRSDRPKTVARVLMPDPRRPGGCGLFLTSALSKEWGRLPAEGGPTYAEKGYTSIFTTEHGDDYDGPMITWAEFMTKAGLRIPAQRS